MTRFSRFFGATAVLLGASTLSHAATPVGQLICNAESNQLQVNLGSFTFGRTQPVAGSTSGPSYQLLDIQASLSQFGPLLQAADKKISKCTIFSTLSDGTQAVIQFTGITLNSVTAVAHTPRTADDPAAMFTEATFQYTDIKVKSSGGADDGGTDGGWFNPKKTTPTPPAGGSD